MLGPSIGWAVSRPITTSAIAMTKVANRLAVGDVKQEITITGQDEIGQMVDAFRQMMTYQQKMAAVASRLAQGDVGVNITAQSEQDVLGKAFEQMVVYQQKMAEIAGRVEQGDLTDHVTPASNQDALQQMVAALQGLQKELVRLTKSSQNGQLATRGKAELFQGTYGEIILAVNEMLDAILLPIGEGNRKW